MTKSFFAVSRISRKIVMGITLILGISLMGTGYIGVKDQRQYTLMVIEKTCEQVASIVAEIAAMPIRRYSYYQLENISANLEEIPDVAFCRIFDREGTQIAPQEPADAETKRHHLITIKKNIINDGEIIGHVELGYDISVHLHKINRKSYLIGTGIFIQLVVVGIAMVLFIRRIIVKPVSELSRTTREIAGGEFATSRLGDRSDEIGILAQSVNDMSSSLMHLYRNLEDKVAERTMALKKTNATLKETVSRLALRSKEISLFNRLNEMLQACVSEEETCEALVHICRQLFPDDKGYIALLDTPSDTLQIIRNWGTWDINEKVFHKKQCWAVRLGKSHIVNNPEKDRLCGHVKADEAVPSLCEPIICHGETAGMFHIDFHSPQNIDTAAESIKENLKSKQIPAFHLARVFSLFLSNLRLRESLRVQAVLDPLTGLYNRRHMEESLKREEKRAQRNKSHVGIMMIDADHFKKINDKHGHEAGDLVLRELGASFKRLTRAEDIACRYGGEEFVLILPDANLEDVKNKAEALRTYVRDNLRIKFDGTLMGITVSIGVSAYPDQGDTVGDVLKTADIALYKAKEEGRDRVRVLT